LVTKKMVSNYKYKRVQFRWSGNFDKWSRFDQLENEHQNRT
jgi:hypothetical protein